MAARKKETEEGLVPGGAVPVPEGYEEQVAKAQEIAELEAKLAKSRADQEVMQAEARAAAKRKDEEQRNKEFVNRTIPVVVQQRRDRPVRYGNVIFECRTVMLVNRRELRHLEGLRSQGRIQLIVGEIGKGEVQVYLRDKEETKKPTEE